MLVLYKSNISNCLTIKSLINSKSSLHPDFKICVWDNSPTKQAEEEISTLVDIGCDIEYTHTPQNMSLAKIYNNVIKKNSDFEFLLLLDQDSSFDESYFKEFEQCVHQNPTVKLFIPLIESAGYIVSPGYFHSFKGKYWNQKRHGLMESKNMIAITSGMIVKIDVFHEIGYFDEQLNLYGIDTNFMIRYRRHFKNFYVLSSNFNHDLSTHNDEPLNTKLRRFKDLRASAIINSKLFPFYIQLLTRTFYLYKSIRYSIEYQSVQFLTSKTI